MNSLTKKDIQFIKNYLDNSKKQLNTLTKSILLHTLKKLVSIKPLISCIFLCCLYYSIYMYYGASVLKTYLFTIPLILSFITALVYIALVNYRKINQYSIIDRFIMLFVFTPQIIHLCKSFFNMVFNHLIAIKISIVFVSLIFTFLILLYQQALIQVKHIDQQLKNRLYP